MRKIYLIVISMLIAFAASSQNNEPAPLLKERVIIQMDQGLHTSIIPEKLITLPDAKMPFQRIPFGSSLNLLSLTATENNNCVYDKDLDIMMFTHRAGGTYGGLGGDIWCHFTPYFGSNIDSVAFNQQGNNRMRYPNGIIYNPAGNTNPANALAIITGPVTNGTYWDNNYFCTQKLDGSLLKYHFEATNDTFKPAYINLTVCDGGKVKVAGSYSAYQDESFDDGKFYFKTGQVQGDSVLWSTNEYKFTNTYKMRRFSNDTTSWAFAPYMCFADDGMIGYFYVMGWEAADPGFNSGPKPIVWKTTDGGTNWTKQPTLDLSTLNGELRKWLKPTRLTLYNDSASMVFRPGIMAGSTVEETNFPGVVDMDGNLHIACNIEGMYSNNIDSLTYTYLYSPWFVFDLHTTATGWDVNLVDTIHADIDKITLTDRNLDHSFHLAKSDDETKLFFTWTDTDSDTSNYIPDIYGRAYDLLAGYITDPKKFTISGDYYFFNAAHRVVDSSGTFYLPVTFSTINGFNTDAEPTHHFIKGLKFTPLDFTSIDENEYSVFADNITAHPNPATDFVNIGLNLTKSSSIKIIVLNLLGSEVFSKNYGKIPSGESKLTIPTSNLNQGIYFFTVQAGNERITKKIVVN